MYRKKPAATSVVSTTHSSGSGGGGGGGSGSADPSAAQPASQASESDDVRAIFGPALSAVAAAHGGDDTITAAGAAMVGAPVLTANMVLDSIACVKKFHLLRSLPSAEIPAVSIGDSVRMNDGSAFAELCRRWDRAHMSTATMVPESDFQNATQRTLQLVSDYFITQLARHGAGAPPLSLHRPAFAAPFPLPPATSQALLSGDGGGGKLVTLRARPAIARFIPRTGRWTIFESAAVTDPLKSSLRAQHFAIALCFTALVLRQWVAGTGSSGPQTAAMAAAMQSTDLRASSLLHARQFFPGPIDASEAGRTQLHKFIQAAPLPGLVATGKFGGAAAPSAAPFRRKPAATKGPVKAAATAAAAGRDDSEALLGLAMRLTETHVERAAALAHAPPSMPAAEGWTAFAKDECSDPDVAARASASSGRGKYASFIGSHCNRDLVCPFYTSGHCLPATVPGAPKPLAKRNAWTFAIPGLSLTRKLELWKGGQRTVTDVLRAHNEGRAELTPAQLRFVRTVASGKIAANPSAVDDWLAAVRYPAFFLDFEAVAFAVPPFERLVSYQPVPFQFSLDVFHTNVLTETPTHYDFIHFAGKCSPYDDPRATCVDELMRIVALERGNAAAAAAAAATAPSNSPAASAKGAKGSRKKSSAAVATLSPLLTTIAKPDTRGGLAARLAPGPHDGCIVAHHVSFEKTCLQKLAQQFPQHGATIQELLFLDTIALIRAGLCHPDALGSNSLKKILPALCPHLSYTAFGDTGDGGGDAGGDGGAVEAQGDNASALYRLWLKNEGGLRLHGPADAPSAPQSAVPGSGPGDGAVTVHAAQRAQARRRWAAVREQLLAYCQMDTRAMYEVVRATKRIADTNRASGAQADSEGWIL